MALTGKNRSSRRKTCHSAPLPNINVPWTGLESNLGTWGERLAINRHSHGSVTKINLHYI